MILKKFYGDFMVVFMEMSKSLKIVRNIEVSGARRTPKAQKISRARGGGGPAGPLGWRKFSLFVCLLLLFVVMVAGDYFPFKNSPKERVQT